ncbi:hypothetical protein HK100_004685, partial [Physocladia obscura]
TKGDHKEMGEATKRLGELCAWVPVLLTLALVAWSAFAFAITAIMQLPSSARTERVIVGVLYAIVLALWTATYVRLIATLPGRPRRLQSSDEVTLDLNLHWVVLVFISGVFGVVLLVFGALHLVYILTNKTTIESMERARRYRINNAHESSEAFDPRSTSAISRYGLNIFDVGARENWCAVMGRDWRYWFLPVHST